MISLCFSEQSNYISPTILLFQRVNDTRLF